MTVLKSLCVSHVYSEYCLSLSELYTVTVLTEAAMMGADIDGDVLLYLDMAQVV